MQQGMEKISPSIKKARQSALLKLAYSRFFC